MKYMQLNNTDLNISPICLGTAGFGDKSDLEKSFEILNAFVRAGGNFIDTANVYCKWLKGYGNCSEQIIGKWLKESGMQGKVIVATKGAHYSFEDPGRSRVNKEDIRMDLDESCRTLGKDEMDFYWLHRDDPEKPAEEIVDILEELKKEGRIRYYGFSCTDAEVDASWMREKETQITGLSESMKRSYWNETNLRTYQKLLKLQKEIGHSLQALSLAYFFHQPFQTVPVTGVSNPSQLKDVLDACEIDFAPELFGGWVSAGG